MGFFNDSVPPLRRKRENLDIQDLEGLWRVNWRIGKLQVYSTYYTRVDQAFILWGILLLPMFITAQFFPVSWTLQAMVWSILSCFGVLVMMNWTRYWVVKRNVNWILYCWAFLMLFGVILTNVGIFWGWGGILFHICPLWLGLSALGYFCTGFAVRSRMLILTGALHVVGITILPWMLGWQFLLTGGLMAACLLLLAEFEWDHV